MYEFEMILLVAGGFLAAYVIGSRINSGLMVKYGRAVKEYMSPRCEFVGLQPLQPNGFRALCRFRREDKTFDRIEIAIALVDRYNLMHYPMLLIIKDRDRLTCWCSMRTNVPSDIDVIIRGDWRLRERIGDERGLREVRVDAREFDLFIFMARERRDIDRLLSDGSFRDALLRARGWVERLSLDKNRSRIYLAGLLKRDSLGPLLGLLLSCGYALAGQGEG